MRCGGGVARLSSVVGAILEMIRHHDLGRSVLKVSVMLRLVYYIVGNVTITAFALQEVVNVG